MRIRCLEFVLSSHSESRCAVVGCKSFNGTSSTPIDVQDPVMSNQFYFTDSADSASNLSRPSIDPDYDDSTTLPFPKPLSRSSFLDPDFDPSVFLSSLSNRFQTLEDLQDELRQLSQELSKELVDLVNENYADFLHLGASLSGGEERVEDVRVGLLGFQRDVGGVRDKVEQRRREVESLVQQKRELRGEVARGRVLLEVEERMKEVEDRLEISSKNTAIIGQDEALEESEVQVWGDVWNDHRLDESDEEYDDETGISGRLSTIVDEYRIIRFLMRKHDLQHPFLVAQRERIMKIRDMILLDLETAIRQESDVKAKQRIIQLRALVDE